MRARQPDQSGYAVNDGVRLYYEVHGSGDTTLLLVPTWEILHSEFWKMQVPYLARHYRVVTYDPRGNGKSDRPQEPIAYRTQTAAADALAVMDATETDAAIVLALCYGVRTTVALANDHPGRVSGIVAMSSNIPKAGVVPARAAKDFESEPVSDVGWETEKRAYWLKDWPGYVDWFFSQALHEPHSTKVHDDLVGWGLETNARTMLCTIDAPSTWPDLAAEEEACRSLSCPVLVIVGDHDGIVADGPSARLAELTGGDLLVIEGGGHTVMARHPVVVNHAIRDFVERVRPSREPAHRVFTYAAARKRKALWVSSPIGLGHALRDLAIARAVRDRVPDLEIHWLAQDPVTRVLENAGEIIHPASAQLASESAHWESESSGHDLHAFYAFRRMDEILLANYMLFDEVTRETPYDLWLGDESWEVDYYLHENPERKTAPYVFTTDVVGFLPVDPENDPREVELCTDYNAQMIEHRARHPRLRDLSLFIGGYDELPDASLGAGLPDVRAWTQDWFESVPYVVPFDPRAYREPEQLKERLGHDTSQPLLVAAVGGTSVGTSLLALIAEGFRYLRKEVPGAQLLMVTGPRIDPRDIPDVEGMTKEGFVPNLFEHLAACDTAIVQGGLSTTMELVAARRPFVYFPLEHHWEQRHFVRHRLDHYRAGIPMEYASTTPQDLADVLLRSLSRRPRYRAVSAKGADTAASRIAPLLRR
jgi:pimeloyl-ACP methyl ester carboxylesterase/UDP:flavonoid glycosyltransferase YjiC (YdhE family)